MSKPKMGRPTKEEALIKAIEAFEGDGIPYTLVDPRNILASIAANPKSAESARIRACIVLMGGDIWDYTSRKNREESDRQLQERMYPDGVLPEDEDEKAEMDRRFVESIKRENGFTACGLSST